MLRFPNSLAAYLLLYFCSPVWGASYYVKSGGNDALDGLSDATAWSTATKVMSKVTSGDIVYFRSQDTWTTATPPLLVATSGVTYDGSTYGSGTRATFQALGDAITWPNYSVVKIDASNVTLKGINVDANHFRCGGIYLGYGSSVDIANNTIDNCVIHGIGGISGDWIYAIEVGNKSGKTISNTVITNSTLYDTFHEGISIYAGWNNASNRNDGVLIRNNTIYNTGTGGNTGAGILVCNDSRNVTVEFNNVHHTEFGIWVRQSPSYEGTVTYGPQNVIIRNNMFHDIRSFGFSASNWRKLTQTVSIHGNLFYNNGQTGFTDTGDIRIDDNSGGSDYTADTVYNIFNNTFHPTSTPGSNSAATIGFGYFGSITAGSFNLKNNIIYSAGYRAVVNKFGNFVDHSNNQIYRSSAATDTHVTSDGTNYNRAGVLSWEPTAKNSAPLFKGGTLPSGFTGIYGSNLLPNTDYFSVSSGDAIDSGVDLGTPYNSCINGAGRLKPLLRPQGEGYDLGAYEFPVTVMKPTTPSGLIVR